MIFVGHGVPRKRRYQVFQAVWDKGGFEPPAVARRTRCLARSSSLSWVARPYRSPKLLDLHSGDAIERLDPLLIKLGERDTWLISKPKGSLYGPCYWATYQGFLEYGFQNWRTHIECLMRAGGDALRDRQTA